MEETKSTGNRFKVSAVGYENTAFENGDDGNNILEAKPPRRSSSFLGDFIMGRRRSSTMYGTDAQDGNFGRKSRKHSIFMDFFKDPANSVMDYSHEAAPRLESYRNSLTVNQYMIRPTLDELHQAQQDNKPALTSGKGQSTGAVKFGWIKGVYIRCLLNIWGVMLFLRMGWMTGQCGIGLAIVIVLLSTVVTVITTLSMSAICTNGDVRGGGAYYLISRSLGPEFGGVVGIILFLANAVSGAMYIIGAGEGIQDILNELGKGIVEFPSGKNDVRLTSILCLLLTMSVTSIGMEFENKTQVILLIVLLIAMMDYFVGACLNPTVTQYAKGFVGWNAKVALDNLGPDFRKGESFFSVFAVFFPSVTGILAGANISGDLKDPCMAIPKGTFLSIFTTSLSYILLVIWLGFTFVRDATGSLEDAVNGTLLTLQNCSSPCKFGLQNDYQVMRLSSGFGPLIYAGIFAATLSSALVSIVSAPRILQALCVDQVIPWLNWFGKGYGADNDPRRALALTFIIAVVFTLIGDLNAVAPIISNFFMAANGLINFSCFHASYVRTPGFRPAFRYYNLWLSLLGAVLCAVIMFVMNWITALVTDVIVIAIYVYIYKTGPDINWGSSFQGYAYRNAIYNLNKLSKVEEHVKNYRPAILLLSGNVSSRPQLVDLAGHLTKDHGLLVCAHVSKEQASIETRQILTDVNSQWLIERKVKGFYTFITTDSLVNGVNNLMQISGIGKMKPNILMMGFKEDWQSCDSKDMLDYFYIIHETLNAHLSLCILRIPGGTSFAKYFETEDGFPLAADLRRRQQQSKVEKFQELKIVLETVEEEESVIECHSTPPPYASIPRIDITRSSSFDAITVCEDTSNDIEKDIDFLPPNFTKAANMFHVRQPKGVIDVWWLYDDGGLTVLLPYIMTTRNRFKDNKLRVFSVAQDDNVISEEQINLAALLNKFRIPFSDLSVLSSVGEPLHEESSRRFETIISKWLTKDENRKDSTAVTRTILNNHKTKTNQLLRVRELLEKHSKSSNLIVMTLPLPRKDTCPAPLYMAWLEILTHDLPPFLFVRGNQNSVLTFYS